MKNGSIANQLKMQERQLSHEKENKQENIQTPDFESKFANSQITNSENNLSNLIEDKQENKQNFNLPDLGLSSALGLFTPDVSNQGEEQAPLKKKKKKPKKGLGR